MTEEQTKPLEKVFLFRHGNLHFTREVERKVFFVLTLGMLVAGILVTLGIV